MSSTIAQASLLVARAGHAAAPRRSAAVVRCQQQGTPAPVEGGASSRRAVLALGASLLPALVSSRALAFVPGMPGLPDEDDIE